MASTGCRQPNSARHSAYPSDDADNTIVSSGNGTPDLAFITYTGPPSKSSATQKLIRTHVMREIGKSRRKGHPVKPAVLEFSLEVPDSSSWHDPSLQLLQPSLPRRGRANELNDPQTLVAGTIPQMPILDNSQIVSQSLEGYQQLVRSSNSPRPLETSNLNGAPWQISQGSAFIERFGGGRSDPFASYPIDMNFRAYELVDHIFDDKYGNFKPFRECWFPIGFMDPAAFHQLLANSALNLSRLRVMDKAPESYEAIAHHTHAIKLVNSRMSDPVYAVSDEVIGSVTAFSCYYNIVGKHEKWRVHMNGLKEIVRLRGGPDCSDFNPNVRLVLSWCDIGGSCTQDSPPTFPLPVFLPALSFPSGITLLPLSARISRTWRSSFPHNLEIVNILDDLGRLTLHLKSEVLRTQGLVYEQSEFAALYINRVIHRLLSLSTTTAVDVDDQGSVLQEACRLASIMYLAEIRRQFGILPIWSAKQLEKLRPLLENSDKSVWNRFGALEVWVLAMGVVETREKEGKRWFVERLRKVGREEGLETVEQVLELVEGFLWIDDLHGVMFQQELDSIWEE